MEERCNECIYGIWNQDEPVSPESEVSMLTECSLGLYLSEDYRCSKFEQYNLYIEGEDTSICNRVSICIHSVLLERDDEQEFCVCPYPECTGYEAVKREYESSEEDYELPF